MRLLQLLHRFARSKQRVMLASIVKLMVRPNDCFRLLRLATSFARDRGHKYNSDPQLLSIAVAPEQTARGIGRTLFEGFASELKRRGVYEFVIIAAHTQVSAISFYGRRGCVPVAKVALGSLPCTVFRYAGTPSAS
jgi:ribosomal protein S18 acetylase RimI-like enzyme